MGDDVRGLQNFGIEGRVPVGDKDHPVAPLDRAAHRGIHAILALHPADYDRIDIGFFQLGIEIGAIKGAAVMLHRYVVAGAWRELVVEWKARFASMEGIVRTAIVLHKEYGRAAFPRRCDERCDAIDHRFAVQGHKPRDLEHGLLHVDHHKRLCHAFSIRNSTTGVQRSSRRDTRALTSSASKTCGISGKSSGGLSWNAFTFTVNQPPSGCGRCAPI